MNPRLRAVNDLQMAEAREYVGLHDYDGVVQDLSPAGVTAALARVGDGPAEPDPHDEATLCAVEARVRVELGELEEHRSNPLWHISAMDVSCYEREYAPAADRSAARRRHLAAWPDAVDAAIESLDRVAAPVAKSLLSAATDLAADLDPADEVEQLARSAHERLIDHLRHAAEHGHPDPSLGADVLARLMGAHEAVEVDLGALSARADRERDRLLALMDDALERLAPGRPRADVVADLLRDHPTTPEGIYAEAREQIEEATAFCYERDLLPELGGECLVGPAPPARRWAMAMMSWAAPYEPDAPSWYHVTPPDPAWPAEEQEEWLAVFSRTTLPAITVHEVTPGHYAHGRMMRGVRSDVRRCLNSGAFVEGWAHYAEELYVEEGFRADDPRYTIGVCIEAILRVTRLACAIGLHSRAMTLDDAIARFATDALMQGPAARAEAERAMYDPTYGRYTWGKLEILALRDRARSQWGAGFTLRRFHEAMLALGAPPLGLLDNALA